MDLLFIFSGKRPPPIEGCPESLEALMTRCWNKDAQIRPTMGEIVQKMQFTQQFFPTGDDPIFPEESSNFNDEDLETLPSSYASAKENITSKSEVDHHSGKNLNNADNKNIITKTQHHPNNTNHNSGSGPETDQSSTSQSGIESPRSAISNCDLNDKPLRVKLINQSVSVMCEFFRINTC